MSKELPAEYLLASSLPFGGYRKRSVCRYLGGAVSAIKPVCFDC